MGYRLVRRQIITTAGSGTLSLHASTSALWCRLIGGGGGCGGTAATSAGATALSGPGGAGGYAEGIIIAVSGSIGYTVGAGGSAGAAGGAGGAGGATTIGNLTAYGGQGSAAGASISGNNYLVAGAAGGGGVGTIVIPGGQGVNKYWNGPIMIREMPSAYLMVPPSLRAPSATGYTAFAGLNPGAGAGGAYAGNSMSAQPGAAGSPGYLEVWELSE